MVKIRPQITSIGIEEVGFFRLLELSIGASIVTAEDGLRVRRGSKRVNPEQVIIACGLAVEERFSSMRLRIDRRGPEDLHLFGCAAPSSAAWRPA